MSLLVRVQGGVERIRVESVHVRVFCTDIMHVVLARDVLQSFPRFQDMENPSTKIQCLSRLS
jgi:hypothetical protein